CVKFSRSTVSCPVSLGFFFQAEDGIRDATVTGVQTCALPILRHGGACGRYDIVRHAAGGCAAAIIFLVIASAAVGGNMQQAPSDPNGSREKSAARTLTYEGATTIGTNLMPEAERLFATHTDATSSYVG